MPNGPSRAEIAENWAGPDYQDETDWTKCDKCEEEFDPDDLIQHEDGNTYCEGCNYETAEDRADARADDLYHQMKEDGEL